MVYEPEPALVNPTAVVYHTSLTSTVATITTTSHSVAATKTMAPLGPGATPLTSGDAAHRSLGHSTCNTGCKATLGVLIPVMLLSLFAIIVYYAWGRNFLKQREAKKTKAVEDGIAMRKLGDEGSFSEWEGGGNTRHVEIGGDREPSPRKPKTVKWWST